MLMRRFFRCYRPKSFRALLRLFTSSLGSNSLRMVILTIILVPLIALLIDHQNHSKWHKWCHVRFTAAQVIIALIYSSIHPASGRRRILRLGLHTIYTRWYPVRCCGHFVAFPWLIQRGCFACVRKNGSEFWSGQCLLGPFLWDRLIKWLAGVILLFLIRMPTTQIRRYYNNPPPRR